MSKRKVLIIEDDQFTREMYQRQFEKSGYVVITANDGEAGLRSVFQENPDFVLLDIILPKMDGVSLLSKLREREKGKGKDPKPVILLTNLGQETTLERCLELDAKGYLIKARFTPSQIVKRVEQILSQ